MVQVVQSRTFQCTCYKCKSVLEYQYSEVKQGIDCGYDGSRDAYQYIVCPVCQSRATVNPK